jgi:hypothetical protein
MRGESSQGGGDLLPPVRTRWQTGSGQGSRGATPLGPVRSGLFVTPEPVAEEEWLTQAAEAEPTPSPELERPLVTEAFLAFQETVFEAEPTRTTEPEPETVHEAEIYIDAEPVVEFEIEAQLEAEPEAEPEPWSSGSDDAQPEPWSSTFTAADEAADTAWETGEADDALELVLEDGVEEGGFELTLDVELSGGAEPMMAESQTTEPAPASPEAFTDFLDVAEALRKQPGPLSAWDLAREARSQEAMDLRVHRAREEWEAFGQALADTLGAAASAAAESAGMAEFDLEPAVAEDIEAAAGEIAGLEPRGEAFDEMAAGGTVEGLEPLGAGFDRAPQGEARGSAALLELAERLEHFAAGIRTEGQYAITRAQLSGDRMEALLAGFAAGWLAARGS